MYIQTYHIYTLRILFKLLLFSHHKIFNIESFKFIIQAIDRYHPLKIFLVEINEIS